MRNGGSVIVHENAAALLYNFTKAPARRPHPTMAHFAVDKQARHMLYYIKFKPLKAMTKTKRRGARAENPRFGGRGSGQRTRTRFRAVRTNKSNIAVQVILERRECRTAVRRSAAKNRRPHGVHVACRINRQQ